MQSVLLIFENSKELEFTEYNLSESGFQVFKALNLKDGLTLAKEIVPDLIVVNTADTSISLLQFNKQLKGLQLKDTLLLCLTELEDYLFASSTKYLVIKPLRPKLLLSLIRGIMNKEEINWLLSIH